MPADLAAAWVVASAMSRQFGLRHPAAKLVGPCAHSFTRSGADNALLDRIGRAQKAV